MHEIDNPDQKLADFTDALLERGGELQEGSAPPLAKVVKLLAQTIRPQSPPNYLRHKVHARIEAERMREAFSLERLLGGFFKPSAQRRWVWATVTVAIVMVVATALIVQPDLGKLMGTANKQPTLTPVGFPTMAASIMLTPGSAAKLIYTDDQGLLTTLEFPADAVTQSITLVLTPTLPHVKSDLAFAGHAFDLIAYSEKGAQADLVFNSPVIVTIHYSPADVQMINDENRLVLQRWMGNDWDDAADTCAPAANYQRFPDQDRLSVTICRTGRLGLFGPAQ